MKSEIIKKEEELRLAMIASDVEKLDALIDDSLVFVMPDGSLATKEMDLSAHRSNSQKISRLIQSEQLINLHENSAVVTVKASLEGSYCGNSISGEYRYMRYWVKKEDGFKIVAGVVAPLK